MSSESSFRARVERRARTGAKFPAPSSSPVELRIDLSAGLESPVTLALLLRDNGLGLARAHAIVTELADKQSVLVMVRPRNLEDLLVRLRDLGVVASMPSQARAV